MRKLISMIMAAAAAVALSSCAQEEFDDYQESVDKVTFMATIGSEDADTKAALGQNEEGKPQSVWTVGDKITVHNGDKGFEFMTADAGASAEFTYSGNDFTAGKGVIAVYPSGDYKAKPSKRTATVSIPSVQTAVAGSYDPDAAISVAYSNDEHLRFKNVTALLKFTVGTDNIKSVIFEGLDGEAITGDIDIEMAEDGTLAELECSPKELKNFAVEIVAPGDEMFVKGETYFVAVAPQTYKKGFNISFRFVKDGQKYPALEYAQERIIRRNAILNLGELKFDLSEHQLKNVTPELGSFKFTVANNPGKILARKLKYQSGSRGFIAFLDKAGHTTYESRTEERCSIDQTNKKITLYLPYLHSRKLVPTFEIPTGTVLICNGRVVENAVTEVDFTGNPPITIMNGNGDTVTFKVEFSNTGLPVVVVNQLTDIQTTYKDADGIVRTTQSLVSSATGDTQKGSKAWFDATGTKWQPKECDWIMTEGVDNFMVYNPDGTSAITDKNNAIVNHPIDASTRERGNVSRQMPKKPFAVKLDKKSGILGMPAHKRWVLLANWSDRTLMRNAIAFDIARIFQDTFKEAKYADGRSAAGIAWNPSGEFVELVYNGVHVGNYFLCEQVKIDENRLDIAEPLDEEDNPYDGAPSAFGYLLESDDAYDEATKFLTKSYLPFLFKDDVDQNGAMLEYVKSIVNGIDDNLYRGIWSDAYGSMDLASFVDFLLIQEVMMNGELANPKSTYSYIPNILENGVRDERLYAGPIWDFDWQTIPHISEITSSSNDYNGMYANNGGKATFKFAYDQSMLAYGSFSHTSSEPSTRNEDDKPYMWYPLLVQSTEFKNLAAHRWNAVKDNIAEYTSTISSMADKIKKSEEENWSMWYLESGRSGARLRHDSYSVGGGFKGDEAMTFDEAVNTLMSNLNKRINGMSYVSNEKWPTVSGAPKLAAE